MSVPSKNHQLVHGLGHEIRNRLCSLQAGIALMEASSNPRPEILSQIAQQLAEAVIWSQDLLPLWGLELLEQLPPAGACDLAEAVQIAVARSLPGRKARGQQLEFGGEPPQGVVVELSSALLVRSITCALVAASLRAGRGASLHVTLTMGERAVVCIRFPSSTAVELGNSRERAGAVEINTVGGVLARLDGQLEDGGDHLVLRLPRRLHSG